QKKGTQHGLRKAAAPDAKAQSIAAFLQSPDQSQTWEQWLRLLLEDMYVLDAASLYVQQTKGGKLYALHRIYGYSHVEQIIVAARLWLARQASNLEYYDKGSVPDGFVTGGKDWGPNEIDRYQKMLDEQLSGQLGERRKLKVIPADAKYTPTKEPALKNDYDEWLARIA